MESMDSRDAVLELILELLAEDEFRAGPSRRARAPGLPARLAGHARHDPRPGSTAPARARAAADDPAGQGRLLGPRARPGRAARLVRRRCSSVKADTDANFELLTRRLLDARPTVRVAIASHNLRSVAHAIAYNRLTGGATATSSCRSCAASATRCRPRSPPRACACARTARWATSSPGWRTWCAGCWRTRRTTRSSYEQARGDPARGAAGPAPVPLARRGGVTPTRR